MGYPRRLVDRLQKLVRFRFGNNGDEKLEQQNIPFLPDDIIVQILLKMPAEQLWKCRTVCKRWYALILNPNFAQKHAQEGPQYKNEGL